ncbi:hypothetical protein RNJ44_02765 [Nakaseomyces bracarensis]|uniref:RING-type domain-containing protein n=1 Tax=Nakaseomyces bracarensis TaxID=273131 RepID=A0ABR4P052_9SACH
MFSRWQKKKKKAEERIIPTVSSVDYFFNRTEKKSFVSNHCTLCEELIANKSDGEKIIELECSHLCHYECLVIFIESISLPKCKHCQQYKLTENECIPKEVHLKDRFISRQLLNRELTLKNSTNIANKSKSRTDTKGGIALSIHKVKRNITRTMTETDNRMNGSINPGSHPLPLMRTFFVDWLHNELIGRTTFEPWQLDELFGLLRLVDILQVSINSSVKYNGHVCMLFEKVLAVVNISNSDNEKFADLTEPVDITLCVAKNVKLYSLSLSSQIERLQNGDMIALNAEEYDGDQLLNWQVEKGRCTVYLRNYSNRVEVIQKWIVGFLNKDILFDQKNITSTCSYLPIMVNTRTENSMLGLFRSKKIIEMGSLNNAHESIIFKRSFNVPNLSQNKESLVETMNTTISSILSLKRERPKNIFMFLQLDINKIREENSQNTIVNTLKAVQIKYPNYFIVVIDKFMQEHIVREANNFDFDYLLKIAEDVNKIPLDIKAIKERFYIGAEIDNVAVLAISNTSMDKTTSCLFSDFTPFVSKGRKRPNELKIKVGYSNIDYTDQINELVEIENWDFLLETLCYSFSLDFDDGGFYHEDMSTIGDQDSLYYSSTISPIESITTLDIVSPFIYDRIPLRSQQPL